MINQIVQKKNIEVDQLHFFDDGNLESLPFSDEIMNAPHSSKFKQLDRPKNDNANGDPVEHLIDFKAS